MKNNFLTQISDEEIVKNALRSPHDTNGILNSLKLEYEYTCVAFFWDDVTSNNSPSLVGLRVGYSRYHVICHSRYVSQFFKSYCTKS